MKTFSYFFSACMYNTREKRSNRKLTFVFQSARSITGHDWFNWFLLMDGILIKLAHAETVTSVQILNNGNI